MIPAAVGGKLEVRCQCQECNSTLGHRLEAGLKADPTVRLAIEAISDGIPELSRKLRDGQPYIARQGSSLIRATPRRGGYKILESRQEDGSRIKSPAAARSEIATTLRREGADEQKVAAALQAHDNARPGEVVEVAPGMSIRKGSVAHFDPALTGPLVTGECALLIAYTFLGIMVGTAVYAPVLEPVRDALAGKGGGAWHAEPLIARRSYEPWHGLAIEATKPYIRIQLRLFGQIAWRVHFAGVSLAGPTPPSYRIDISTGKETWSELPAELRV